MPVWFKLATYISTCVLVACGSDSSRTVEGFPPSPYKMTLTNKPTNIVAGQEVTLITQITLAADGSVVKDLDTLHERRVHNFITKLDFTDFAHIHHEDFKALTNQDIESGALSFPYTFPENGKYRMVSEFTHERRSWIKHFDIQVGVNPQTNIVSPDYSNHSTVENYNATLSLSPATPIAGTATEMTIYIEKNNLPIKNLNLWLGSEAHVAIWRDDGKYFGHTHSYTPTMKKMMRNFHHNNKEATHDPISMKKMMYKMMSEPAKLIFEGPTIPVFFIFPEPGKYVMYIECAPSNQSTVFRFVIEVLPSTEKKTHEHTMPSAQNNM